MFVFGLVEIRSDFIKPWVQFPLSQTLDYVSNIKHFILILKLKYF